MKTPRIAKAMENIDDELISAAEGKVAKKKRGWIKWGAIAACLCIVAVCVFVAPNIKNDDSYDYAVNVVYNDAEYVVCGEGETEILNECGLPAEITKDLAGKHLGYFKRAEKNTYYADESGNAELFKYAPQPDNGNVYILCIDGKYYAAIRRDSNGYHGLTDD